MYTYNPLFFLIIKPVVMIPFSFMIIIQKYLEILQVWFLTTTIK